MTRIKAGDCPHLAATARAPEVASTDCRECGVSAPTRVCLTCGHVGCCETTRGHARDHTRSSGHLLIRELPLSPRSFTWCYGCNAYIE